MPFDINNMVNRGMTLKVSLFPRAWELQPTPIPKVIFEMEWHTLQYVETDVICTQPNPKPYETNYLLRRFERRVNNDLIA